MRQVRAVKGNHRFPRFAQIQQFPRILSSQERRSFFFGVGLLILGIAFLVFGSFSQFFVRVPQSGGSLTEGVLGYPQFINPLYADANTADKDLSSLIYEGLLSYNPATLAYEPRLAESISLSEDQKVYTVTLRTDVSWHDGEVFGVYDVLFTYTALQNTAYGSPIAEAYKNVALAQVDDRTVTFTLSEPYAAFPELLSIGILPAHLWEEISPVNARLVPLNLKPVGTGPFVLEKTSKDSRGMIRSITLRAFSDYYGTSPFLEEVIVKFFSNTNDILQALQAKRIDTTAALSSSDALSLQDDDAVHIAPLPLTQYVGVFFQTQRGALQSADLRKALTLALDIGAIAADATGNLSQPTAFALPGFAPSSPLPQDLSLAATTLDTLGWTLDASGKRKKGETELSLALVTADRADLVRAAERIAESWRSLGITVSVTPLSHNEITSVLKDRSYDVLVAAEQYGAIADPFPFWHSTTKGADGLNMSVFSTPETDAALTTLRTSSDVQKRNDAYSVLQNTFSAQFPAVFLFQNSLPFAHSVDILGITAQSIPTPSARWSLLPSWYLHTGFQLQR